MFATSHRSRARLVIVAVGLSTILSAIVWISDEAGAVDSFLRRLSDSQLGSGTDRDDDVGKAVLREGTSIPPTPGRVVMIGRRWAFIPAAERPAEAADNFLPLATTPSRWQSERTGAAGAEVGTGPAGNLAAANQPPAQMLICENLMLQRVVEAIREDAGDDRWTLTGEVTEFFDQNLLIIRTAQRANTR